MKFSPQTESRPKTNRISYGQKFRLIIISEIIERETFSFIYFHRARWLTPSSPPHVQYVKGRRGAYRVERHICRGVLMVTDENKNEPKTHLCALYTRVATTVSSAPVEQVRVFGFCEKQYRSLAARRELCNNNART